MNLLKLFIPYKVVVIMLIWIAFYLGPHDINLWNRWYTGKELDAFYIPFVNWDGQHYLLLSDWGYNVWDHSKAFFPLFPLLIRSLNVIVHNVIYSGLMITLLASTGLLYFMHGFARHYGDEQEAMTATALFLLWPASFFFSVIYSEAVFVLLMLGFVYFYHVNKDYRSLVFAFLMPLAKGQALFFVAGIGVNLMWRMYKRDDVNAWFEAANLLAFLGGGLAYLLYFKMVTGSYWSGLQAQSSFVLGLSAQNIIHPLHFMSYLVSAVGPLFDYNNALMDRLFIIAMFIGLIPVLYTKDSFLICCYVTMTYCLASVGEGSAFVRYSLLPAPFLMVALQSQPRYIQGLCGLICMVLQVFFILRFAQGYWVG